MAAENIFGRSNGFVLKIIGFLITGVLGSYLAQSYTTKNAELATANKIFSEYSKLTGDRYFTMNQVMLATRSSASAEQRESRWNAYRLELQKWNSARAYNREMIKQSFGQPMWNKERDIHYFFRAWGQSLEAAKAAKDSVDFDCLEKERDQFLATLHGFNISIGEAIQAGNIGSRRPKLEVEQNARLQTLCLTHQ